MGCDANLYLPLDIEPKFISEVVAAAMGAKVELVQMDGGGLRIEVTPTKACPEKYYKMESTNAMPGMLYIGIYGFWYCERVSIDGEVVILNKLHGGSNPATIALFRKVAQAFGGWLEVNDCKKDVTFEFYDRPEATMDDDAMMPQEQPHWDNFQQHIQFTTKLTLEEFLAAEKVSSANIKDVVSGNGGKYGYTWADDILRGHIAANKAWATMRARGRSQ